MSNENEKSQESGENSESDGGNESQQISTESAVSSKRKVKKKSIDVVRKLEVIEFAKKFGNNAASKKFKVERGNIRRWRKKETELKTLYDGGKSGAKRLKGAGRKYLFGEENDHELLEWLENERKEKRGVSRKSLLQTANEIYSESVKRGLSAGENFLATDPWLSEWLKRHKKSLRRRTTVCQKPPSDYVPKLIKFILFVRKLRIEEQYKDSCIIAADETAVWFDNPRSTTITEKGAREVPIMSTGHEKLRVTVMLTAKSDGTKCLPYVVLNRKRPVPEIVKKFRNKIIISWAGKIWMDDTLTEDYLRRVLGKHLFDKRLLVWDSFRCHFSDKTKSVLKDLKIDIAVVPGGCTKFIQPPDVSWNAPFKAKIRDYYESWMKNGKKSHTPAGHLRPPTIELLLEWIEKAWAALTEEIIRNSFKCCGITNAKDGSEDDLIHCFKEQSGCAEGRELLREEQRKIAMILLKDVALSEEIDTEQDDLRDSDDASDCDSVHSVEIIDL